MGTVVYFAVLVFLTIWAAFWIIRLAVRYGVNDALRMNRDWLTDRDGPVRVEPLGTGWGYSVPTVG